MSATPCGPRRWSDRRRGWVRCGCRREPIAVIPAAVRCHTPAGESSTTMQSAGERSYLRAACRNRSGAACRSERRSPRTRKDRRSGTGWCSQAHQDPVVRRGRRHATWARAARSARIPCAACAHSARSRGIMVSARFSANSGGSLRLGRGLDVAIMSLGRAGENREHDSGET